MQTKNTFTFDEETRRALSSLPQGFRSGILAQLIQQAARIHEKHGNRSLGPLLAGEYELVMNDGEGR